jgi:hypothetical protein
VSIFGTTPTQPGDTVRPKDAERVLAGHLLQELRHQTQTSTERNARLASQVVNGVLEAGTFVLDAAGRLDRSYHVAIGSVVVVNTTGAIVTVSAGGSTGGAAPTSGDGVHLVPIGQTLTVPLAARQFTLYGTPGASVTLHAWTGLQPYGIIH